MYTQEWYFLPPEYNGEHMSSRPSNIDLSMVVALKVEMHLGVRMISPAASGFVSPFLIMSGLCRGSVYLHPCGSLQEACNDSDISICFADRIWLCEEDSVSGQK